MAVTAMAEPEPNRPTNGRLEPRKAAERCHAEPVPPDGGLGRAVPVPTAGGAGGAWVGVKDCRLIPPAAATS